MINRTGHVFPDYQDPWSGKKASDGVCTNWVKVATPIEYDSRIDRGIAIKSYIDKYGDPEYSWNRSNLDIWRYTIFSLENLGVITI